jgi:hypothetical protein
VKIKGFAGVKKMYQMMGEISSKTLASEPLGVLYLADFSRTNFCLSPKLLLFFFVLSLNCSLESFENSHLSLSPSSSLPLTPPCSLNSESLFLKFL